MHLSPEIAALPQLTSRGVVSTAANSRPHWAKTPDGYALGGHRFVKSGRTWRLFCDGREYDLGRRASFDIAETLIHCSCLELS